ncbi:ABC transporter permease [Pigmentiphaga litoralis]|uniref:ABC-type nitrate/sulfonate/bicarbonate transport system permease component n=1 Tax=Pigmentiphaga litoralis TaxID=516702 RepID=A0A7Y9IT90_9BURK|nr:ABC transporter permease [Pigmentiphaga litoralis]NYE23759.1 ABC-type nitrate/sulfonate/bicarbonate transport system permease component [Pigmentiphaga litoralis]NYE82627.1 ABC-type nitrate/sulfonate/bicarbonate transport system permease component [Pigmentiphaga litoralis]
MTRAHAWPALARQALRGIGRCAVPLAVILAWQWMGSTERLPHYLSWPGAIWAAARELSADGELWMHVRATLLRLVCGFAIGAMVGVLTGMAAGMSRTARNFLDPLVAVVNPVPKIAFLPVVLLVFGLTHATQIAIVALSVSFPVFLGAQQAVAQVDRHLIWVARNFETPVLTLWSRVVFPAALPGIFAGLRVGLALSFVVLFAAELIGAKTGLSRLIVEGEEWVRYDIMLTGILGYAVLGFLADRLLLRIRHRVLRGSLIGTQEART